MAVQYIEPTKKTTTGADSAPALIRTCCYARVSTDSDEQETSFQAQIDEYTNRIKANPTQEFVGVYADQGISGTSASRRPEFQRLLADCRAGKIDLVLTKSISRFCRNVKECISISDELLSYGVDIFFEKEGIHTANKDGTAMLIFNILATFAEQESKSISQNVKWGIDKKMEKGELVGGNGQILGYDYVDGTYVINEEQAETVRRIYDLYLKGFGYTKISRILETEERKTVNGSTKWNDKSVQGVLVNEKYYGAVLSQKTYVSDFMLHKRTRNLGKVRQVYNDSHHPAIISKETFDLAQQERERRARCASGLNPDRSKYTVRYPFSEHLYCAHCGDTLKRLWRTNGIVWQCRHKLHGETVCTAHGVHNTVVEKCFIDVYNMVAADNQAFFDHFIRAVVNRTKQREQKNDVSKLDKQIKKLESQIDELVMMKARREIEGEFYSRNYQALKEQLIDLQEKRAAFADTQLLAFNQKSKLEQIKCVVFSHEAPLTEFDGDLFSALVEKVIVHSPVDLTFVLYGGMEYRMDGSKYKPKDGRGRPRKQTLMA